MRTAVQLAKHFREVHFGRTWTDSDLSRHLKDINWNQATTKVHSFNTIAALVYHINYYISAVLSVLEGEPLKAKDADSFGRHPIQSREDWENLVSKLWKDAERLASLVEQLPESKLEETFVKEKYGSYYRNIQGIIEHTYYHLGQIVLIKKLLISTADE
jgi:uncharacterized damage-inducible protein DinB